MSASIKTTTAERKLGFRVLFLGMFAIGTGQTLFIAVLPPTEESTWANRVVGTWIKFIPL